MFDFNMVLRGRRNISVYDIKTMHRIKTYLIFHGLECEGLVVTILNPCIEELNSPFLLDFSIVWTALD